MQIAVALIMLVLLVAFFQEPDQKVEDETGMPTVVSQE